MQSILGSQSRARGDTTESWDIVGDALSMILDSVCLEDQCHPWLRRVVPPTHTIDISLFNIVACFVVHPECHHCGVTNSDSDCAAPDRRSPTAVGQSLQGMDHVNWPHMLSYNLASGLDEIRLGCYDESTLFYQI